MSIPSAVRLARGSRQTTTRLAMAGWSLFKAAQALEMSRHDPCAGLGLDGDAHVPDHEVDFGTAREPPIGQVLGGLGVIQIGGKLVEHPVLERLSVGIRPSRQPAPPRQAIHDADVRQVELRRTDHPSFRSPAIRWQPLAEEGVLKNLVVRLGRGSAHTAVGADVGEVDQFAVA